MILAVALALAVPAFGETYSWLDDRGTMHFTEDLSRVPKKFRKKMRVQTDLPSGTAEDAQPASANRSPDPGSQPKNTASQVNSAFSGDANRLYGGKSEASWRTDLGRYEAELRRQEMTLDQLKQQITTPAGGARERLAELTRKYNEARDTYNRTYSEYSDLLESARKAGLVVEMRK